MRVVPRAPGHLETRTTEALSQAETATGVGPQASVADSADGPTCMPAAVDAVATTGGTMQALGAAWGRVKPIAAAATIAALAFAQPAVGAELTSQIPSSDFVAAREIEVENPEPNIRSESPPTEVQDTSRTRGGVQVEILRSERLDRYDALLDRLESLRDSGRITGSELMTARRALWDRLVVQDAADALPKLPNGRVDLVALARGLQAQPSKGQEIMEQLANDLEQRMRVTARDMAHGYEALPGADGLYKTLEPSLVRRLVVDALERIPLGELPLGDQIGELVRQLPNTAGIDVERSSLEEILDELGDTQEAWLRAKLEPLIEGRELEAGIVAFGAVTGLRWASPEAAAILDDVAPRLTIYRESRDFDGRRGRADVSARLAYRDAEVLPQLDLEAGVRHRFAEGWTARANVTSTFSVEGEETAVGTATVGVGYQGDSGFVDTSLAQSFGDREDLRLNVRAAWDDNPTDGHVALRAYATARDAEAFGRSDGTWGLEIDATRPVQWRGAEGEIGAFTGFSGDLSGGDTGVAAGVVFRLRF